MGKQWEQYTTRAANLVPARASHWPGCVRAHEILAGPQISGPITQTLEALLRPLSSGNSSGLGLAPEPVDMAPTLVRRAPGLVHLDAARRLHLGQTGDGPSNVAKVVMASWEYKINSLALMSHHIITQHNQPTNSTTFYTRLKQSIVRFKKSIVTTSTLLPSHLTKQPIVGQRSHTTTNTYQPSKWVAVESP